MEIQLQKEGRRIYLIGDTYPIKSKIKEIGGKWDSDRRAWWVGSSKEGDAKALIETPVQSSGTGDKEGEDRSYPDTDPIAGRAEYASKSGKLGTYYLAGRIIRGETRWDDQVEPVTSKSGKFLLVSRDGSFSFWADGARITKSYSKPQTLRGLREYAESAKSGSAGECAECGRHTTNLTDAPDSSGIVMGVCGRCAGMSRYERSYC